MDILRSVAHMQSHADAVHTAGETVALVPTMGALHGGHLSLVDRALEEADHVVTSIFVNPTQFGPDEDFEEYPRDLDGDAKKLKDRGVDVVFAPSADEMYPHHDNSVRTAPLAWVDVDEYNDSLCGKYRDGHFRGVTTIVTKLFHACKPDVAVFGQKDAQQLAILRRMVDELLFDVEIVAAPIVREADGLAMSSRNAYLSDEHREQATVLFEAVQQAESAIQAGEQDATRIVRAMQNALDNAPDARVQYAEVVDSRTLVSIDRLEPGQDVLAAVAVFFGDTRLIDNALVCAPDASAPRSTEATATSA
ncbi:pantoate--beta-alanine ligase [Longibacter salinarum]|uniref:Pantothenate synthetase n=1 Tax=Longibacter salinarum TaxID=1850348 RepID=A0A2A8D2C2_9BACT|nr:pantoate--beta-alanine ligase [Longibacter salinarum]PEN14963.1 pantoate--beta-alanine ligase [Longibacter salinarum]